MFILRRMAVWLIKNLIVILLVALIFSTVALDLPNMIKGVFGDIFNYSSPDAQKEVIGKLTQACSALDSGGELATKGKSPLPLDFSKIGALCKDYGGKKINDQEFFFGVIGSAIPDNFELPKAGAFEKYKVIIGAFNKNKMLYFAALAILLALLYLLIMDIKLFMAALAGICFSMGIMIILPYAAIIAYERLVGIDTTPILNSILQGGFSFDIKAIISVVLLMVLRTYTSAILALGAALLAIGIAGRIYVWKLNRQKSPAEIKAQKKPEKKEPPKEERPREAKKSTQEILDELENMQKEKLSKS